METGKMIALLKLTHKMCADVIVTLDNHQEHAAAVCFNELTGILHETIGSLEKEALEHEKNVH